MIGAMDRAMFAKRGCGFWCIDPAARSDKRGESMATIGNAPVILVIVGDPATRNTLIEALHWAGFSVVAAANAAQALATIESRTVSLVVSDARLRGLSGAEVLQKLRDREALQHLSPVPFILLSGDRVFSTATSVRCLGAPVSAGELVSVVSDMLTWPVSRAPSALVN